MPTVTHLVEAMESIAPTERAEAWDNVGLLVGDPARELRGAVLLTIDLTEAVTREALDLGAGAVLAYHPPLFHPRKRLTTADGLGRSLLALIEAGVAIYSPHTALDAADEGVTDWLLDQTIGAPGTERRALTPHERLAPSQTHKIVAFVPIGEVERVRTALADAGAGVIGAYTHCSFNIPGTGTFHGTEGTSPAIGASGRHESVDETRLEMVCPASRLADVVAALRAAHTYEEPAFDVYTLAPAPDSRVGAGRIATLDASATPTELAARLKKNLGLPAVKLAAATDDPISRVAACPGAGASLLDAAIASGAQLFVTGEMRHHEVLGALDRGCAVLLAGHTNTERGYLPVLRDRLTKLESTLDVRVSGADRCPLTIV